MKLSGRRRRRLPRKAFASPRGSAPNRNRNQYPIHDRAHAANAKARATQAFKAGRLSKTARNKIHAKANRVLKRKRRR